MELMFWDNAVLWEICLKNMSPSPSPRNKIPYGMQYGCIPLVRHLKVFGSTYYALIRKKKRNKLGARSHKGNSLGYSNTTKAYQHYDQINKKSIHSRDVGFIESTEIDNTSDEHFDHLDIFSHVNTYHDFVDEIPHLEVGILILDQCLESPLKCHLPLMNKI